MSKYYYSAESTHGSESSFGFCNDIAVLVWNSKAARDKYVAESSNLSCQSIKRSEVTKYAANYNLTSNKCNRPEPFTGEHWVIDTSAVYFDENPEPGLVGTIGINREPYGPPTSRWEIPFYNRP